MTVARKRAVVPRHLRGAPVELLARQLGLEIFRLEQWRETAIGGIDAEIKQPKGDPVQAEPDSAMTFGQHAERPRQSVGDRSP